MTLLFNAKLNNCKMRVSVQTSTGQQPPELRVSLRDGAHRPAWPCWIRHRVVSLSRAVPGHLARSEMAGRAVAAARRGRLALDHHCLRGCRRTRHLPPVSWWPRVANQLRRRLTAWSIYGLGSVPTPAADPPSVATQPGLVVHDGQRWVQTQENGRASALPDPAAPLLRSVPLRRFRG